MPAKEVPEYAGAEELVNPDLVPSFAHNQLLLAQLHRFAQQLRIKHLARPTRQNGVHLRLRQPRDQFRKRLHIQMLWVFVINRPIHPFVVIEALQQPVRGRWNARVRRMHPFALPTIPVDDFPSFGLLGDAKNERVIEPAFAVSPNHVLRYDRIAIECQNQGFHGVKMRGRSAHSCGVAEKTASGMKGNERARVTAT